MGKFLSGLVARHWPPLLVSVLGGSIAVFSPSDWNMAIRGLPLPVAVLISYALYHRYEIETTKRNTRKQLLLRLRELVQCFEPFVRESQTCTYDSSLFQAAAKLIEINRPTLNDWFYAFSQSGTGTLGLFSHWRYALAQRLDIEWINPSPRDDHLVQLLNEVSLLVSDYQAAIEEFCRTYKRTTVNRSDDVRDIFNKFTAVYNVWIQKFCVLRSDAKQAAFTDSARIEERALTQQPVL